MVDQVPDVAAVVDAMDRNGVERMLVVNWFGYETASQLAWRLESGYCCVVNRFRALQATRGSYAQ
jgi:hypothetical protein